MATRRRQVALRRLHESLVDLIAITNLPQRDEILIREAGITLDRALFPLLVGIQRFGPIGVVELADRAGRDHTTVSRQGGSLKLLNLTKRITDLLSITKLLTVFETFDSENEAVRSFSASAKV